jgi:hypothetical protein
LLPLPKMAAILALGFVIGAMMDHLALGVPLDVIRCRVWDCRNS